MAVFPLRRRTLTPVSYPLYFLLLPDADVPNLLPERYLDAERPDLLEADAFTFHHISHSIHLVVDHRDPVRLDEPDFLGAAHLVAQEVDRHIHGNHLSIFVKHRAGHQDLLLAELDARLALGDQGVQLADPLEDLSELRLILELLPALRLLELADALLHLLAFVPIVDLDHANIRGLEGLHEALDAAPHLFRLLAQGFDPRELLGRQRLREVQLPDGG